jgi:hypothetical protein
VSVELDGGEAQRLVKCSYGLLGLFGSEADLVGWAKRLQADSSAEQLVPRNFAAGTAKLLLDHLREADVLDSTSHVDDYRLRHFQQVVSLLPYFRLAEEARRPPERTKVVFTVPVGVTLPDDAKHLQRALAVRIFDALVSSTERTLLASPFWSEPGADSLWDPLQTSVQLGLPITLAGARRKSPDDDRDHDDLAEMLALASRLRDAGGNVTALRYVPARAGSYFHAKLACGSTGYLGSANFTGAGLGHHVEAGLPLDAPDIHQVWWLLDALQKAKLLVPEVV